MKITNSTKQWFYIALNTHIYHKIHNVRLYNDIRLDVFTKNKKQTTNVKALRQQYSKATEIVCYVSTPNNSNYFNDVNKV